MATSPFGAAALSFARKLVHQFRRHIRHLAGVGTSPVAVLYAGGAEVCANGEKMQHAC